MTAVCAACGTGPLEHHLTVKAARGASLVATTTRYGAAPADLVRCRRCGHMQVSKLPSEAVLDEAYAEVDEAAYLQEEEGQRATARRALERIERHAPPARLLDLGCWLGFLLSEAAARGWTAQGVEPSRFAAAYARGRLGLDVETATLHSADLPEDAFAAVTMNDVIEHLPDPGDALRRVHSLLTPGGVLYMALPDAGSRVARALGARWWSVLPTHVQYFTRASVRELLGRQGFVVEWVGTAPKAFTVHYYLERLEGYSRPAASTAVAVATRAGAAHRLVCPDFRDRMAVVARRRGA